jgi:hypothetical protein
VCVCAFSLRRESPDIILGDKPLISEAVLSHLLFLISSPNVPSMATKLRRHMVKSSTDSPSLNWMLSNSARSRCVLAFRTASLPIHRDLTASHAYAALFFTASDASISCDTAMVIASHVTSPVSMVPQRFLAFHDQCPLRVVHLGENWPICWPGANLPHNSLPRAAATTAPT